MRGKVLFVQYEGQGHKGQRHIGFYISSDEFLNLFHPHVYPNVSLDTLQGVEGSGSKALS